MTTFAATTYRRVQATFSSPPAARVANILAALLLLVGVLLALVIAAATASVPGVHWQAMFWPAAKVFVSGGNPYGPTGSFFNPPWTLLVLAPFAYFPAVAGQIAMALACSLSFYFVARQLGASRLISACLTLLPQTLFMYQYVNLDWMGALGLLMPAPIGLFFVLVKPQLGLGIAIYWLVQAWNRGRFKSVLLTFGPLAVAGLLSILLYGPWFTSTDPARLSSADWSLTWWPWSIPFGLFFMVVAIRRQTPGLAVFGGALLSPYMAYYSWTVVVMGLLGVPRLRFAVLLVLLLIGAQYS